MTAAVGGQVRHQVVAALLKREGRVLLCHRSATRRWYPDVWDLPGGHVEAGEAPTRALVRELREELGVTIEEPAGPAMTRVSTSEFEMQIWLVETWTGSLANAAPQEHDALDWFDGPALDGLRLAHDIYPRLITGVLTGECAPAAR